MPNRYIREDAIESEALNSVSWQAEVFYRRLLNRVDDFGRFTANPSLLRASLFPLQLSRVSDRNTEELIAECESAGLLFRYEAEGKRLLVINKWEKGRATTSKYPPPPADVCERMQAFVYGRKQAHTDSPDSDSDTDSDNGAPALPEVLDSDEFRKAWADYEAHRRELRLRKLKAKSVEAQWREMAGWGLPVAIESIRNTIRNGWQGLFHPQAKSATGKPAPVMPPRPAVKVGAFLSDDN